MKKSRCFHAGGIDALEDRVVLSNGAASAAAGVIHGHKARLVAADFANFQSAYNSTIIPLAQDMQAAEKSGDDLRVQLDSQAIGTQVNNLVNGLGDQLAKQLHKKMFARIRAEITGAPAPTTVGLVSSSPTQGSMQATLAALPSDIKANATAVDGLISVYQNDVIDGNLAPRSRGDFVKFEYSLNQAASQLPPGANQQQVNAAVTTVVNGLGTQLSKDLGPGAYGDIQTRITGASGSGGVTIPNTATPASGSLMATLDAMSADDFYSWDFINDLALAYSSSSTNF